mmetsp:Transcript_22922/g.39254  ORF Transcript_22922/g.39254 Transcript_22922/m.39254 type:complete len:213 (+) Transcript_22922:4722-5360(+)
MPQQLAVFVVRVGLVPLLLPLACHGEQILQLQGICRVCVPMRVLDILRNQLELVALLVHRLQLAFELAIIQVDGVHPLCALAIPIPEQRGCNLQFCQCVHQRNLRLQQLLGIDDRRGLAPKFVRNEGKKFVGLGGEQRVFVGWLRLLRENAGDCRQRRVALLDGLLAQLAQRHLLCINLHFHEAAVHHPSVTDQINQVLRGFRQRPLVRSLR